MDLEEIPLPPLLDIKETSKSTDGYEYYMGCDTISPKYPLLYIPPSPETADTLVVVAGYTFSLHLVAFKIRGLHFDNCEVLRLAKEDNNTNKLFKSDSLKSKYNIKGSKVVFSKFIAWMYENLEKDFMSFESNEVACVFEIATQLGAWTTIEACVDPIRLFKSSLECCLRIYSDTASRMINRYNAVRIVHRAAMNRLLIEAEYLKCLPNFKSLSHDRFRRLIYHNELNISDEVNVLRIVFEWLLHREDIPIEPNNDCCKLSGSQKYEESNERLSFLNIEVNEIVEIGQNNRSTTTQETTPTPELPRVDNDTVDLNFSRLQNIGRRSADAEDVEIGPGPAKRTALMNCQASGIIMAENNEHQVPTTSSTAHCVDINNMNGTTKHSGQYESSHSRGEAEDERIRLIQHSNTETQQSSSTSNPAGPPTSAYNRWFNVEGVTNNNTLINFKLSNNQGLLSVKGTMFDGERQTEVTGTISDDGSTNMLVSNEDGSTPWISNISQMRGSSNSSGVDQISNVRSILKSLQTDSNIASHIASTSQKGVNQREEYQDDKVMSVSPRHIYTADFLNAVRWERIKKFYRVAELFSNMPDVNTLLVARGCIEVQRLRGLEFGRYWSGSRQIRIPESITEKRPRVHNEVVFTTGGWRSGKPRSMVNVYDPSVKRWYNMPKDIKSSNDNSYHATPRVKVSRHVTLTWERSIYVIGGLNIDSIGVADMQRFDLETGMTVKLASMLQPRFSHFGATHEGKLYIFGGQSTHDGACLLTSECYDIENDQWTFIKSMNRAFCEAACGQLNGYIYVCGGEFNMSCMSSTFRYNIYDDKWSRVKSMSRPRCDQSMVVKEGKLFVIGGRRRGVSLRRVESYDPGTDQWSLEEPCINKRSNFGICLVGGKILIAGGYDGTKALNSTEIYDPNRSKHWSQLNNLSKPLAGTRLVSLDNLENRSEFGYYGHSSICDKIRRSYLRRKRELRMRLAVMGREEEITDSDTTSVDSEDE